MANKNTQGPPDLGDLLLKLLQPLLNLYTRLSAKIAVLQQGRSTPSDSSSGSKSLHLPPSIPEHKPSLPQVPITKKSASHPRRKKVHPKDMGTGHLPLAVQLRDRNFLRQAIVVNEILAKPVALRPQSNQRL